MIYFGMTIGPVTETLFLTSSPAGLWAASYLFSDITYRICQKLEQRFRDQYDLKIYSPYFGEERLIPKGIGSYHDRVIFSCRRGSYEELAAMIEQIIEEVKDEVAQIVLETDKNNPHAEFHRKAIRDYFAVRFLSVDPKNIGDKENVIAVVSPALDVAELDRSVSSGLGKVLIKEFLEAETSGGKNQRIKESAYFREILGDEEAKKKFQLLGPKGEMKSLGDIAKAGRAPMKKTVQEDMEKTEETAQEDAQTVEETAQDVPEKADRAQEREKPDQYIAIVQADGDRVGGHLCRLPEEKIEAFSKQCMDYSKDAAEKIGEFGGVTIFAGGDDLLFLAPVKNKEGKSILKLCSEIDTMFKKRFEEVDKASVSFGIHLSYQKSPLYESLKNAAKLLFADAKEDRNTKAVQLTKHSGQSVSFRLENESELEERLLDLMAAKKDESESKKNDEQINAVLYHLHEFHYLYDIAVFEESAERIRDFFSGTFDTYEKNEEGKFFSSYLDKIEDLALKQRKRLIQQKKAPAAGDISEKEAPVRSLPAPAEEFTSLLRFVKFFSEKAPQRENLENKRRESR